MFSCDILSQVMIGFRLFFSKCINWGRSFVLIIGVIIIFEEMLFIHGLYYTGYSFSELLNPLFQFKWIFLKLFLKWQLNPVDISFDTGVDFLLNFHIDISSISKLTTISYCYSSSKLFTKTLFSTSSYN